MPALILKGKALFLGGYDISGDSNQAELLGPLEVQDRTTWGDTARRRAAALVDASASVSGFADFADDANDEAFWAQLSAERILTAAMGTSAAQGERVYSLKAISMRHQVGGSLADLAPFSLELPGVAELLFGWIEQNAAVAASGSTSGQNLGAVAAGQKLWAIRHVIGVPTGTAPTLDTVIESDTSGFPTPTTRLTFGQATARGAEMQSVAGPITDTFFRATHTVGGTTPNFPKVVVLIFIQ